jgi:hypothetical protein
MIDQRSVIEWGQFNNASVSDMTSDVDLSRATVNLDTEQTQSLNDTIHAIWNWK